MSRRLGKYELGEELGRGGMATVFKAHDTALERDVAIKVMHPHLQESEQARDRFAQEARAIAQLRHSNILEVYDTGEDGGELFIAMELLTGPTLKQFVELHGAMPTEVVAAIGMHVADAIQAAHDKGIIHRDIKPENVLIHDNRDIKLSDFGIAHIVGGEGFTRTGQMIGSPGHMAPEQIEQGISDERGDIFGLGTTLYFLATGELPFEGENAPHTLRRVMDVDHTPAHQARPSMGRALADRIEHCLERHPANRPPSAKALVGQFRTLLESEEVPNPKATLGAYLRDPESIATQLKEATIQRELQRARVAHRRRNHAEVTRACNRVLSLDEHNTDAVDIHRKSSNMGLQKRRLRIALLLLSVGCFSVILWRFTQGAHQIPAPNHSPAGTPQLPEAQVAGNNEGAPPPTNLSAAVSVQGNDPKPTVAASNEMTSVVRSRPRPSTARRASSNQPRTVRFQPEPQNISISVDDGPLQAFGPSFSSTTLAPGRHRFRFVGADQCCKEQTLVRGIPPGPGTTVISPRLEYRPGGLYVEANRHAGVFIPAMGLRGSTHSVLTIPFHHQAPGRYQVQISEPGGVTRAEYVELLAGKVSQLRVSLAEQ